MNPGIETKKSPGKRQEPFSLHATLAQYEIEELDVRQAANLLNETRRKGSRRRPTAAA